MDQSPSYLRIREDRFLVDVAGDCLKLQEDPLRKLPFSQMESTDRTGYHAFLYDPVAKQIYEPPMLLNSLPAAILYVEIPSKAFLDPAAISREMGYTDRETDPAFKQQSSLEKEARIIPRVKFLADEFFVDFRKMAFVDTLDTRNEISFNHAIESEKGTIFLEYDLLTRKLPDPLSDDYIEDTTAILMLPPYPEMDPDGWKEIQRISTSSLENSVHFLPRPQPITNRKIKKGPVIPTGRKNKSPRRNG